MERSILTIYLPEGLQSYPDQFVVDCPISLMLCQSEVDKENYFAKINTKPKSKFQLIVQMGMVA